MMQPMSQRFATSRRNESWFEELSFGDGYEIIEANDKP